MILLPGLRPRCVFSGNSQTGSLSPFSPFLSFSSFLFLFFSEEGHTDERKDRQTDKPGRKLDQKREQRLSSQRAEKTFWLDESRVWKPEAICAVVRLPEAGTELGSGAKKQTKKTRALAPSATKKINVKFGLAPKKTQIQKTNRCENGPFFFFFMRGGCQIQKAPKPNSFFFDCVPIC